MRLINKAIIVSGGANGIGRHYVASLVSQGAKVLIADIDLKAAAIVAESLNQAYAREAALACEIDVTSEADTVRMAKIAVDQFGRIDVLLNNAGTYPHVEFEDTTYEMWRHVVALNLDSVFLCCKAIVPIMKAQGSGKIINVATNLVWVGLAGMVSYISAKAGIIGFTRSLARELGEYGIMVNAVAPGAVIPDANYNAASRRRIQMIVENQCVKRQQKAEDLPGTVIYLASSDSDFVSGQIITVDGGLTNH